MSFFTWKKLLLIGFIAVLLAVIPLTVSFLQSTTQTESKAEKATTLCFALPESSTCLSSATPVQKNIGDVIPLDIYLDPGGKNSIVVATVSINYDQTKLTADPTQGTGLGLIMTPTSATATQGFTQPLVDAAYTPGNASITLTVGTDALKAISQKTKIATITFKALAAATTGVPITFDDNKSNATSTIDPEVDVLSTKQPALIQIASAVGPTSTIAPTQPASTIAPTQPAGATVPPNQIPLCTGLNVDRATSGPAPFSITFTANGNDPDPTGTISSVTFDFGDGPVQTVTSGGGIGTRAASVAVSHTYNNPTTFTVKATLTDDKGGLSVANSSCTQTVTVTAGPTGTDGTGSTGTTTPTTIAQAPTETPTPLPQKNFETPPGPGNTILGIGAVGAALTIIGALAFFAL